MTKMSNLPRDLAEGVLSRIPLASLRSVRSTCKKWNTLSKDLNFAEKHLGNQANVAAKEREIMMVMMMDFKVYLMSVNLHNNVESCIKRKGKLICLDNEVDVDRVFHCDGLLLCISKDKTRVVVWNPYWGQTRWINPETNSQSLNFTYALGYEESSKSCRKHKILRFIDADPFDFKIYDINSDSWRVLDITPYWHICSCNRLVSHKGNMYSFAKKMTRGSRGDKFFLVSFDFTKESFGPLLPLPFKQIPSDISDTVSVSSVREEQLAVLVQREFTLQMEIWVTTKIEPNAVSWNSKVFLEVNMKPIASHLFQFKVTTVSFFIDEEKEVAVVFCKDKDRNVAYIVEVDGSSKKVDLGVTLDKLWYPLACSYVQV